MGGVCFRGCCGDGERYDLTGRSIQGQEGEWRVRGQLVLRTFAQVLEMVNVLGVDEDATNNNDQRAIGTSIEDEGSSVESDDQFNWLWNPICEYPVHVNLACIQEGEIYEYTVYAEEKELCPFTSNITIPGTDIKKTGPYFVQWKDVYSGKVYGLNFFTESEGIRFLSSCFPPSYTPDTATDRTHSSPSYVCPSPPPPISRRPKLPDTEDDFNEPNNPHYGFDYLSLKPVPQPEFFKPPSVTFHHLNAMYSGNTQAISDLNPHQVDAEQNVVATALAQAVSVTSDVSVAQSESSSLPSQYLPANDDGKSLASDDDPELFQASEPLQVNKILEDIPEEDEDSRSSILNGPVDAEKTSQTDEKLEFDEFLKDLRRSQLLELTERGARLSKQFSFSGGVPPPVLPPTLPPGPMLSPQQQLTETHDSLILPPPLVRQDSDEFEFKRVPSFIRYPRPPDAFSSDSGLQSDTEEPAFKISHFPTIRELEVGTTSSVPSETTESIEAQKFSSNSVINGVTEEMEIGPFKSDSIKKTGWLNVKGLLIRKNKKVAMKAKRRWKRYWAVLRGKHLFLHRCDQHSGIPNNEDAVDMKIDISYCLAHSVHDHLKRDHLFCLSTYSGNTYYMQASNQSAVDEWIRFIHSAAALSVTGQISKEGALEKLNAVILENKEAVVKEKQMKNLAELQLTTVFDNVSKSNITTQIINFSENIEKCEMNIYRSRCYLASLDCLELPNPQQLLASVSKHTKTVLNKVGNFSVASFHAVVCVRSSTVKQVDINSKVSPVVLTSSKQKKVTKKNFRLFHKKEHRRLFGKSKISLPVPSIEGQGPHLLAYQQFLEPDPLATGFGATLQVKVPSGKICAVPFRLDLTVEDVIFTCCKKFGLDPADHFLKLTATAGEQKEFVMPHEDEFIDNLIFTNMEICQKFIRSVQFNTSPDNIGLSVCPDLKSIGSVTHVIVESVTTNSEAEMLGLNVGDEIVLINDLPVTHMSWAEVMDSLTSTYKDVNTKKMFVEPKFSLTLRTRHYQAPTAFVGRTTHVHLHDLVCPSPPVEGRRIKRLDDLIVPMPSTEDLREIGETSDSITGSESDGNLAEDRVHQLIKESLELTGLVDRWKAFEANTNITSFINEGITDMNPQKRILNCVSEIIKSESHHIKQLELVIDRYLEPMKLEMFLPRDKMAAICNDILTVMIQQKQFLARIENLPDCENVKKLVHELSEAFMIHLDTFKQYSKFCAAQHDIENIFLKVQDHQKLKEFLEARNPKQDPSLTLQSLLLKPVLRLLQYPVFLHVITDMTDKNSDEHQQLTETLKSLIAVTEHINEVKRVTETYADVFDSMLEETGLSEFGISVCVSELLHHLTVMWLNPIGMLSRNWKKGQGPEIHFFVFKSNVTLLHVADQPPKKQPNKASLKQTSVTIKDITHSALLPLAQCKVNDLPDSDGVSAMWQVVHKGREINTQTVTYILRSKSLQEKVIIIEILQQAIQAQLALYTSLSPTKTIRSESSVSQDSLVTAVRLKSGMLKNTLPQLQDSIDSEYELTLL